MNKTTYYINGNAVRELDEAAPVRRPQKSTRELEEIRRKKNRRTSARRNQERALSMNRAFVAFLTACVAASALVSVSLIQIRSNVTQQMKEVAALESQINDMKADNDARYKQGRDASNDCNLDSVDIVGDLLIRFVLGFINLLRQFTFGLLPCFCLRIYLTIGVIHLALDITDTLCNELNGSSDFIDSLLLTLDFLQLTF